MNTIDYYNQDAESFFRGTIDIDMTAIYEPFLKLLPDNAYILDAGCGSGRDSLYFLQNGYSVTPLDASEELSKLASKLIKQTVSNISFQEIEFENEFDGIWASASLLHILRVDIKDVLNRITKALKQYGILYASFKYGTEEYEKDGRLFNCYHESSIIQLLNKLEILELFKLRVSNDSRPNRQYEKWLNCLIRKI